MNVAFFLTPKRDVVWIPDRATMRQALERMEYNRYAAVPVLDEGGRYRGTLTEGDLLFMLKHNTKMTFADTEHVPIADVPRRGREVRAVHIDAEMEDLYSRAVEQNFIPVVDDNEVFIGIVRRSTILDYTRARIAAEQDGAGASAAQDWLCVLDVAGVVVGVEGGAPRSFIGRRFEDCSGLDAAVRDAARKLVRSGSSRGDPVRRRRVPSPHDDAPSFTLLALDAVILRPAPCDLEALVRRAIAPLLAQAEAQGARVVVEGKSAREAIVDEDKIGWAIATLVGNALRHAPRGTTTMLGGNVRVAIGATDDQAMLSVTVEDDGPGIGDDVRPWLFEPDPETGRAKGLALKLVQEVAAAHGGGVIVKSSTDAAHRGTAITLWLPASRS